MRTFETIAIRNGSPMRMAPARVAVLALAGVLAAQQHAIAQHDPTTPEEAVGALEQAYGVHPGQRRNHAKGVCALGNFVGTEDAAIYSRSGLFAGGTLPVVARFSLGGGSPTAPDAGRGPRGMALEFKLPDGSLQHMTMIDSPIFFARTPKTFLDNAVASIPDPSTGKPDPEAQKKFAATHPDNTGMAEHYAKHNPPPSYANSAFFSIHTFKFENANDATTLVKWRFVAQDGEKELSAAQLNTMPNDFLEQALIARTKQGPVRWDMIVTIGEPGDAETDPTIAWPAGRKEIKAGTLTLSEAMPDEEGACYGINYDPLVMSDGIRPTDDPILLFRSPSYAVSFAERIKGQ